MNSKNKRLKIINKSDCTSLDDDADKTGTDTNSDHTLHYKINQRFDKPTRETNPDQTRKDTNADFTKQEPINEPK